LKFCMLTQFLNSPDADLGAEDARSVPVSQIHQAKLRAIDKLNINETDDPTQRY